MSGLSVVIPSRNLANLEPCTRAVREHEPHARIIWVDDSDEDREAEIRQTCGEPLWRARGEKPFAFARNVNIGIRAASADDVIILNDDALLKSPCGLTLMRRAARDRPEFGVIGSTCNNVGNQNQLPQNAGLRVEPRMVCFVCVLIPRTTVNLIGLLDERYTDYGCEDDDYCFAVRAAGLKIDIHDGCYVGHGSLVSSFRGPDGSGGDYRPNLKRFIEQWGVDHWDNPPNPSENRQPIPCRRGSQILGAPRHDMARASPLTGRSGGPDGGQAVADIRIEELDGNEHAAACHHDVLEDPSAAERKIRRRHLHRCGGRPVPRLLQERAQRGDQVDLPLSVKLQEERLGTRRQIGRILHIEHEQPGAVAVPPAICAVSGGQGA